MSIYDTALEDELGKERDRFMKLYEAARRQIDRQNRYIAELEKQLEYLEPGLVKEAQEWVERNL
jgi:hypothetical protein